MRTTLNIDDDLLRRAQDLSGLQEKTALIREGLKALIERESARRLASLGGRIRKWRASRAVKASPNHDSGRYLGLG
jgi:Arc/MetJ family transcription regulator